jgi:hypothetical protein
MDNINVIRIGFYAPQTVLNDTEMHAADPVSREQGAYTCLAFVNPNEKGAAIIKTLEKEIASLKSTADWCLAVVLPLKPTPGRKFKASNSIAARVFCDSELRAGKKYCIVDTSVDYPAYHPTIFFIGDDGSVRQRMNLTDREFDTTKFRDLITSVT